MKIPKSAVKIVHIEGTMTTGTHVGKPVKIVVWEGFASRGAKSNFKKVHTLWHRVFIDAVTQGRRIKRHTGIEIDNFRAALKKGLRYIQVDAVNSFGVGYADIDLAMRLNHVNMGECPQLLWTMDEWLDGAIKLNGGNDAGEA